MAAEHWAFIRNGVVMNVVVAPPVHDEALLQSIKEHMKADTVVILNSEDYQDGHVNRPGPNHFYHEGLKTFYKHPDDKAVLKMLQGETTPHLPDTDIPNVPGASTHTGRIVK